MPYVSVGFDFMCEFRPKTKTSVSGIPLSVSVISRLLLYLRKMIKFYFEVYVDFHVRYAAEKGF